MDYTGYSKYTKYRKLTNEWNWFVPCIKSQVFWTRLAWGMGMDSYESYIRYQERGLFRRSYGDAFDSVYSWNTKTNPSTRVFADYIWNQTPFQSRDSMCFPGLTRQQAVERFLVLKDQIGSVLHPDSDKKCDCFIKLQFYGRRASKLVAARIEGEERVRQAQTATAEYLADYLAMWWASPYRGLLSRPGRQPMVVGDPSMLGTNGGYADFSSLYAADPGEFYLPE